MIRLFWNTFYPAARVNGMGLMTGGILFILLGLLIIMVPEILIFLIASIFISTGALLLFSAWQVRRFAGHPDKIRIHINE